MKIRAGDLRRPRFFFLYSCSDWKEGEPFYETRPYKFLTFSLREETGTEILSIVFRCPSGGKPGEPKGIFPLNAWGYSDQSRAITRLLGQIYPGSPWGAFNRLVRALWRLKIPRFHYDKDSGRFLPWRYRAKAEDYFQALSLVSIG